MELGDFITNKIFNQKPKHITSIELPNNNGIFKVYVVGNILPKYKFVHEGKRYTTIKYAPRLLSEQMPLYELQTGIHDNFLWQMTGCLSHRNFK